MQNQEKHDFFSREWRKFLVFSVLVVFISSCTKEPESILEAKVFALNPSEYVGTDIRLSGRVADVGPGGAFFVFEDKTGKVLVTTESLPYSVKCPKDSQITLTGALRRHEPTQGYYFSMTALGMCHQATRL